jgi:hypothetical protein
MNVGLLDGERPVLKEIKDGGGYGCECHQHVQSICQS